MRLLPDPLNLRSMKADAERAAKRIGGVEQDRRIRIISLWVDRSPTN